MMKVVQAFVASHPKAGATWLRFLLAQYLSIVHDEKYVLNLKNMAWFVPYRPPQKDDEPYLFEDRPEIPLVCFSHHMPSFPEYQLTDKIVLQLRHPFALVASRFFHVAHHAPDPEAGSNIDIFEFAMKGRDGLANTRGFLNGWAPELKKRGGIVLTYEEMDEDIRAAFSKFLTHCGIPIDRAALIAAIENSDKAHMIDAERRDPLNPEAGLDGRKARVHFVGHYTAHFSISEMKAMHDAFLAGLSPEASELLEAARIYPHVYDPAESERELEASRKKVEANPILQQIKPR